MSNDYGTEDELLADEHYERVNPYPQENKMPRPLSKKKQQALVLRTAAGLIEEGGLAKHHYRKPKPSGKVSYCMAGAIREAAELEDPKLTDSYRAMEVERLLEKRFERDYRMGSIPAVNDRSGFRKKDALRELTTLADELDPPKGEVPA